MGSTESKMAVSAPVKAEPSIKHGRVSELMDPRSPSTTIDRTPIQVSSWTQLLMHLPQLNREDRLQGFSWDRLVWCCRLVIPLKNTDTDSQLQTHVFSCGTRRLHITGLTIPNFLGWWLCAQKCC